MVKKAFKEAIIILGLVALLAMAAVILIAPCSPAQFPMHWNVQGQIDGWGSKTFTALFVPLLGLSLYFLMLALPKLDPLRKNYSAFSGVYYFVRLWLMLFFDLLFLITLLAGWGILINPGPYIIIALSLFFVVMGAGLAGVKKNYFLGIRTPWTLQSEEVWTKTHQFSGRVFILVGLLAIPTAFLQSSLSFFIFLILIMGGALLPVIYSYVIYKKLGHFEKS